jgi:predicted enzyme related to lactoylglutathione lyase
LGKAKSFYGKMFDWKLEDVPLGDSTYIVIGARGQHGSDERP